MLPAWISAIVAAMTPRRWMIVMLATLDAILTIFAYLNFGANGFLLAIAGNVVFYLLRQQIVRLRSWFEARPRRLYRWWGLDVLMSYRSEVNLTLGAIFDFLLALIIVILATMTMGVYLPRWGQFVLALLLAIPKYLWSTDFFRNSVGTYKMRALIFLKRIVPSGPIGLGLTSGYYWTPLGRPVYELGVEQDITEITLNFDNMQVWAANSGIRGQGAIQGETDGVAQFIIYDPGAWNSVADPRAVLQGILEECARDVAETRSIEEFIATRNDQLADETQVLIDQKLENRARSLGVACVSVNVKRTDNKNEEVKEGWGQITKQRAIATARNTDARARAARIARYGAAGVDANRAMAGDLVASDKAGATIGDQRYNGDVGQSLKDLGQNVVNWLTRRP